ncbi:hypothetical protein A8709_23265 [Paenibacillus pectinilyticus]|uniref:HTH araC/xylS-type domain-containing protein n=1 Tax=Paenibacillus pectinilyticus TaxID=512399 RepID=A0A1C0ZRR1_9BACL|nr:helix-turn-helix domain-containing protein [Paenibacillus pectinilyticus]OCT10757.1 hypothetical protein A8709_23265 [Paenibacillus pectinilyticus]
MEYFLTFPNMYSAFRMIGMNYARTDKDWSYPKHKHTYFEFLYCVEGVIEQTVGGTIYELHPGDAIVMKAGSPHASRTAKPAVYFGFHFDVEMKAAVGILQNAVLPLISSKTKWSKNGSITTAVEQLIHAFRSLQDRPHSDPSETVSSLDRSLAELSIQAQLLEFITDLCRFFFEQSKQTNSGTGTSTQFALAHEAASLLEAAIHEPLKIHELAERLNVNRSYLSECFKKIYGLSLRSYWAQTRTHEAKKWLTESELSIEQIADKLQFSSASHFCQHFRQWTGLTPHQFRNQNDKENLPTANYTTTYL